MFWLASKLFWLVFHPLSLAMLSVMAGLLLSFRRRKGLGLSLTGFGLAILLIAGMTSAGALLMQPLEARYPRPDAFPENAAGVIALGGGTDNVISAARKTYELANAGERYVEAVRLALAHPDIPVLVTGGVGNLYGDGESDAESTARLFEAFGLGAPQIRYESKARNTYENAINSAALFDPQPGQPYVLITSAYHMPRSVALFEKAGFDVVPWPVDFRTTGETGAMLDIGDATDNIDLTATAMREWIGLIAYWATGRIDSIFP